MATTKQKHAARRNLERARAARSARAQGKNIRQRSQGTSTAEKHRLSESDFAFPEQRKEPVTDARHVRNAIARFDQVEGVGDAERDRAWRRIRTAARRYHVDVSERSWRDLFRGGKARRRR